MKALRNALRAAIIIYSVLSMSYFIGLSDIRLTKNYQLLALMFIWYSCAKQACLRFPSWDL
jgi:hypothetical protein